MSDSQEKLPAWQGVLNYWPRALLEVARVSQYGSKKHGFKLSVKGFLQFPGVDFADRRARHELARCVEGELNPADDNCYHLAQIAWSALTELELLLLKKGKEKDNGSV